MPLMPIRESLSSQSKSLIALFIRSALAFSHFQVNVHMQVQGRIQRFWKGLALYVIHHGWPMKKILCFRWSKKAKIKLETISFWQNISISIFKFSPSLYTMKAGQWNIINFSKLANALIRKEKKHAAVNEKRKAEKSWTLFYNRLFYKVL